MDPDRQVNSVQDTKSDNPYEDSDFKKRLAVLKSEGVAALYRMQKEQQRRMWAWSQNVIAKYAKALQDTPRSVRSVAELSHTKADIKVAIQLALMLHVHKGDEKSIKLLRDRYLELASFQEITAGDREKVAKKLNAKTSTGKNHLMPIYSKYTEIAAAERIRLVEQFDAFVADLKKLQP